MILDSPGFDRKSPIFEQMRTEPKLYNANDIIHVRRLIDSLYLTFIEYPSQVHP